MVRPVDVPQLVLPAARDRSDGRVGIDSGRADSTVSTTCKARYTLNSAVRRGCNARGKHSRFG